MSADEELQQIMRAIGGLEGRFVDSRQLGKHLPTEHEAEFKRLVVEATSILDGELGPLNNFSRSIRQAIASGSGGFLGGPSFLPQSGKRAPF